MKKTAALVTVLAALCFFTYPAYTQTTDELNTLRQEIETLKEGQKNLQNELQEIKKLLRTQRSLARDEFKPADIVIGDNPFNGNKNAEVTLIEFSDYQCPFCARHFSETLPQIEKDYIKTGKVKYVLLDFPLEAIHKNAFKAHEAANCAGDEGKYWEMHDRLFSNIRALSLKDLSKHAEAIGLDLPKFQECLESGRHAAEIRKDMAEGQKIGVRGTPTFLLGLTNPDDSKLKATTILRGAQPYSQFREAIDNLLTTEHK